LCPKDVFAPVAAAHVVVDGARMLDPEFAQRGQEPASTNPSVDGKRTKLILLKN
jgi:hypothetical protein